MRLHSFRVKICYPFELLILRTLSIYKHSSRRDGIHSADSRNEFVCASTCIPWFGHLLTKCSKSQSATASDMHSNDSSIQSVSRENNVRDEGFLNGTSLACLSFVWVKVNGWTNLSSGLLILCSSNKSCMRSGIRRCLSIGTISDFDKNGKLLESETEPGISIGLTYSGCGVSAAFW
jgi:hypothetical protein